MKNWMWILLICTTCVWCLLLFAYTYYHFEPSIHKKIDSIRQTRRKARQTEQIKAIPSVVIGEKLVDEPDAWYTKYTIIAHGGGGIDGKINTNSIEAWNLTYQRGVRLYDVDLNYTSDHYIVCRHAWDDNVEQTDIPVSVSVSVSVFASTSYVRQYVEGQAPLCFSDFKKFPIYRRYSSCSIENLLQFMLLHSDMYFILDFHHPDIEGIYKEIHELCINDAEKSRLLDRMIISVYNQGDVHICKKIYPKVKCMRRFYYVRDFSQFIAECMDDEIHAITISTQLISKEIIQYCVAHGIHVYAAVVNYESDMDYYTEMGCSGVVSDFIYEK